MGVGRMKGGIKDGIYGWCALYTYMEQNNETCCNFLSREQGNEGE
jgi:hypothetical protein